MAVSRRHMRRLRRLAYLLSSKQTLEREVRSLLAVEDNYPKYLLSMDNLPVDNPHGVARRYLPDWLLGT